MKTKEFFFDLPSELIAQSPPEMRGQSRLFVLDPQNQIWQHRQFPNIVDFFEPGTILVFNDSRVRKARVFAKTKNGGALEAVFLQPFPNGRWECLVNKAKKLKAGQELDFPGDVIGRIETPEGQTRILHFEPSVDEEWLEKHGHLPLPPYIRRPDSEADSERYQTVYAKDPGSAAAPTAGLHFTNDILAALKQNGVETVFVTLRVGLGTFLPVRSENIEDHRMHSESFLVEPDVAERLTLAKREGRTIAAIGTTSLRTLESCWDGTRFRSGEQQTDIFISPGYRFQAVDTLFTNFHTPESTLLMLVSAFAGKELIFRAYEEAVRERYRFFSYGDAMLILGRRESS